MKKKTAAIVAGATLAVAATAGIGYAVADKDVQVTADGQTSQVHTFGSTVADALKAKGITVGPHDVVVPGLDSAIHDGSRVSVAFGRQLTVTLNGKQTQVWTTANTAGQALDQIGIAKDASLSISRSTTLGRQGLNLVATTPKTVTLVLGSAKPATITSTAATVDDLLTAQKVTLGAKDKVTPGLTAPLTAGMKIVVTRVTVATKSVTTTVPYKTVTTNDPTMASGTKKVTAQGVNGNTVQTIQTTTTNGKVTSQQVISSITTQPVDEQVTVGTQAASTSDSSATSSSGTTASSDSAGSSDSTGSTGSSSSTSGLNLADSTMWDRIAQCESSGNWSLNDGSGYYGGLQFDQQTWDSVDGQKFAARADLATRAQQIDRANALRAQRGLQPWACAHAA